MKELDRMQHVLLPGPIPMLSGIGGAVTACGCAIPIETTIGPYLSGLDMI